MAKGVLFVVFVNVCTVFGFCTDKREECIRSSSVRVFPRLAAPQFTSTQTKKAS